MSPEEYGENTAVFVLRIWRERRETMGAKPVWRGVVIHVPSARQCYFDGLAQLQECIATHLEWMEGNPADP